MLLFPAMIFGQAELQFVQKFSWKAAAGAASYEISIEKQTESKAGWENVIRQQTEKSSAQASLRSGHYRYAVTVFNFFQEADSVSAWVEFDVLPALQPEISFIKPDKIAITNEPVTIAINGKNLLPDSQISLQMQKIDKEKSEVKAIIQYNSVSKTITIDTSKLQTEFYRLVITNPGGLSTDCALGVFKEEPKKPEITMHESRQTPFDFQISEGWAPLIPVYGAFNDLLETEFFPIGLGLRVSILPFRGKFGSLGLEIEPFWHILKAPHGKYIVQAHFVDIHANLQYQLWFAQKRFALNLRAGGGFVLVFDLQRAYDARLFSEYDNTWIPVAQGGISLTWCFLPPFFVDIGASLVHIFSVDDPPPAYIRPSIFLGFKY